MYRVAVLQAKRLGLIDASDEEKVAMIDALEISWKFNTETWTQETYMNWENVEQLIRKTDHMKSMEKIVKCLPVRAALAKLQRIYGETNWIVADGRDMWTVVYPDADVKIFLECDLEVRVTRRVKQLQEKGLEADADAIRQETKMRDAVDYLWPDAVWSKAADAIIVDTTHTTIQEQIDQIVMIARWVA